MIEMGLVDSSWELSYDDIISWDSLTIQKREEMDLRMAIYAAMIDRMDQNIGKLIDNLKTKKLYNNTLIMYINDIILDNFDLVTTYFSNEPLADINVNMFIW